MSDRTCSVDDCAATRHAAGLCGRHYMVQKRHGDPLWERPSLAEWFWPKVHRRGPDECWEFTGSRDKHGYGQPVKRRTRFAGERTVRLKAHRVAFELHYGRPPEGDVRHSCDHPPCCNPAHLADGTHAENMREMAERGRSPRGERNAWARLTEDDVREIRRRCAAGELQRVVAADFGVIRQAVQLIVARKRWGHVE